MRNLFEKAEVDDAINRINALKSRIKTTMGKNECRAANGTSLCSI